MSSHQGINAQVQRLQTLLRSRQIQVASRDALKQQDKVGDSRGTFKTYEALTQRMSFLGHAHFLRSLSEVELGFPTLRPRG